MVKYEMSYSIGNEDDSRKVLESHLSVVAVLRQTANDLLNNGRKMNRLRKTNDPALIRECGKKMRKYQQMVKDLSAQTEALSFKYYNLKVAVIEMRMCVSCSRTAMEACGRAAESLNGSK